MSARTVEAQVRTRVEAASQRLIDFERGWMAVRPLNTHRNPALEAEPVRLTLDGYIDQVKGMLMRGQTPNPTAIFDYDPREVTSGFNFPYLLERVPPVKGNETGPAQRRARSQILVGIDESEKVVIQTLALESYKASFKRVGENNWRAFDIERITLAGTEIIQDGEERRKVGFGLVQALLSAKQPGYST
jgi:hypothetical protein